MYINIGLPNMINFDIQYFYLVSCHSTQCGCHRQTILNSKSATLFPLLYFTYMSALCQFLWSSCVIIGMLVIEYSRKFWHAKDLATGSKKKKSVRNLTKSHFVLLFLKGISMSSTS